MLNAATSTQIIRIAKRIFLPIAFGFIGYFLWFNLETLIPVLAQGRVAYLLAVCLAWVLLHALSPLSTINLLRSMEFDLSYREGLRIHVGRLPAKYLPGGIWHSVARAEGYSSVGLERQRLLSFLLIENMALVGVTLGVGGLVVSTLTLPPPLAALIGLIATLSWLLLTAAPWIFRFIPGLGMNLRPGPYFLSLATLILYWCLAGVSFALYLQAFPELELAVSELQSAGVYVLSWGVGYLALFAPQGLGVSELVSGSLLGSQLELGGFLLLLLCFRLLMLVADLVAWAAYWCLRRGSAT